MATPTNLPASFSVGQVLTAAEMNNLRGAFRILQVVSTSDTTSRTTTGDYPQVSTLNVSITPQSASSQIFIVASLSVECNTAGTNVNKIGIYGLSYGSGSTTSIYRQRFSAQLGNAGYDLFGGLTFTLLHSPATTSACIYNVLFGRYSASFDNGVTINGDAGGGTQGRSTITAFEISA
jgi:hypothetical protein